MSSSLAFQIKSLAAEMGFDPVGITHLASLKQGEEAIEKWVKEGRHGSMKYLEDFKLRRARLLEQIPDAKSVICLGVNYYSKAQSAESIESDKSFALGAMRYAPSGRVARYAWGRDYHQVIRSRHAELIGKLKQELGENFCAVSCVDTQPIPERFAALQSGFGFIGKHTGILNEKYGPWLFLSEIVTNLDLEADEASEGDCGTCDHCQKICPTGALDEDYKIDARICIAYLTIEHKGVIPRELRPKIKDWIFGCDECMSVCPFTSKQKETTWPELGPKAGNGEWLLIEELLSLPSNKAYERKFAGTPLLRAGLKQMLRNACIVLGNSKREEAIPLLEKALNHRDALVRLHAAWALGQIPSEKSRAPLQERLSQETDEDVKNEIQTSLAC
ncbi:MAG: tRNA epoxyqueuosine(34) reductase QueG [Candidatus Omnitrophica bacterium]|nr:tRNA epoxyqueuosine(34) reductase QueG [Candidatus Omnitrophota bacterium]